MARPQLNSNAQYAYEYYKKRGYSDAQAAGMVGNLMQESTMNTNARNKGDGRDGSDSIGIGQWNGSRASGLRNFADKRGTQWNDLDTQLEYTIWEKQNGGERRAGQMLSSAQSVDDATKAGISYERPQGWSAKNPAAGHGYDNRLAWAREIYAQNTGENPPAPTARPTQQDLPAETNGTQLAQASAQNKELIPGTRNAIQSGMEKIGFSGLDGNKENATFMGMKIGGDSGLMDNFAGIAKAFGSNEERAAPVQVANAGRNGPLELNMDIKSSAIKPLAQDQDPRRKRIGGLGGLGGLGGFNRGWA